LSDSYEEASAEEVQATADLAITQRSGGDTGKALLDGGCYVKTLDRDALSCHQNISIQSMIHPDDGARCLALFYLEAQGGDPAVMAFPGSHVALFVLAGNGEINISGKSFPLKQEQGIYVSADEAFALQPADDSSPLQITATLCPGGNAPEWLDAMPDNFDESLQERVFSVDPGKREVMADRFYQVLIDDRIGSADMTQFVGEVPKSRAAFHHHLYEETITILSGQGYMWTEGARAEVKPGDVIFLPRRQMHSLECTDPGGMRLVGVFFPAGSPAVNY